MTYKLYDGRHGGRVGSRPSTTGTGKGQSALRSKTSAGGHVNQTGGHKVIHEQKAFTGGNMADGTGHQPHGQEVGKVGKGPRGSPLSGKGNVNPRDGAGGKGLGSGHLVGSSHHPSSGGDCFHGTQKSGVLRVSGHKGAHQVGKRTSRGT